MVPVPPVTVIVMMPPMAAGFGPETTVVTVLEAALMVSCTALMVMLPLARLTAPARAGLRSYTTTLCDCELAVALVAVK